MYNFTQETADTLLRLLGVKEEKDDKKQGYRNDNSKANLGRLK